MVYLAIRRRIRVPVYITGLNGNKSIGSWVKSNNHKFRNSFLTSFLAENRTGSLMIPYVL